MPLYCPDLAAFLDAIGLGTVRISPSTPGHTDESAQLGHPCSLQPALVPAS